MGTATAARTWRNKRTWTILFDGSGVSTLDNAVVTHGFVGITAPNSQLILTGRYTSIIPYGSYPLVMTATNTQATIRGEGAQTAVFCVEKVHSISG